MDRSFFEEVSFKNTFPKDFYLSEISPIENSIEKTLKQESIRGKFKPENIEKSKKKKAFSYLKTEDYLKQAKVFLNKRQYRTAGKLLQKGILEVGKTAEAYHLLGLAFFYQGFFKESLKQFQKATEMEAKPEYFLNLSIALNDLGHYELAQKAYEKAFRIKKQTRDEALKEALLEKHIEAAKLYLKRSQLKLALEEYIKAVKLETSKESDLLKAAKLEIARLLWKLKYKEQAKKYLTHFISLYPRNIKARFLKAELHFESQQVLLAINEWENILKMEPKNHEAMNYLLKAQNINEL